MFFLRVKEQVSHSYKAKGELWSVTTLMSDHEYPEDHILRWYDHVLIIDPEKKYLQF